MQVSPYKFYGTLGFASSLLIMILLSRRVPTHIAYLIAVNLTTFLAYGLDKMLAARPNSLRIPENVLHTMAIAGGSIGGLIAQNYFRHKTMKTTFQTTYWVIVVIQVVIVAVFFWLQDAGKLNFL